jgi:lysophospholipase L1-like esterase
VPERSYTRYVALGDSQTEGIGDGDDLRGHRGWADRLAQRLAAANPDLRYANLAVRGKLAGQVHAEQLQPALALAPDLATVVAGVNDLRRPGFDAAVVAGHLEAMFAALTGAGAQVATFTFPDIGRFSPLLRPLKPRVIRLNTEIRAAAARHRVIVVDTFDLAVTADLRLWCPDRLHANPAGHDRIAAAMADGLGIPGSDDSWTRPLPVARPRSLPQAACYELRWITSFGGPWIARRIRGRSSGDGRTAKRPLLEPVR